jgi:Holliday junction resolvase RusA-like endonuclease
MNQLEIILPGNVISKKNSKRICRGRLLSSKAFLAYEKACLQELMFRRVKWLGSYPVEMHCQFFRKTKQKFDYSNMMESLQDILVKAKVIADDDYQHVIPCRPSMAIDKDNPRAVIILIGKG